MTLAKNNDAHQLESGHEALGAITNAEHGITQGQLREYLGKVIDSGRSTALLRVQFDDESEPVQFNSITVSGFHERVSKDHGWDSSGHVIDIHMGYKGARLISAVMTSHVKDADSCGSEYVEYLTVYCSERKDAPPESVVGMVMQDEEDPYGGFETSVGDILEMLNDRIKAGILTMKSPFRIYVNGDYIQPSVITCDRAREFHEVTCAVSAEEQAALNSYKRYNVNSFEIMGEVSDFDSRKMLDYVSDVRDRATIAAVQRAPELAPKLITMGSNLRTTAVKDGMTVSQLHEFLGVLLAAGLQDARVESGDDPVPITKAGWHSACFGGFVSDVQPLNAEEVAAVFSSNQLNNGWVKLVTGASVPQVGPMRMQELYKVMEARIDAAQPVEPIGMQMPLAA